MSRADRAGRSGRMRSQVQPGSFPLLLVATLLLYVLNGLAVESTTGRILARVARTGVSGAAIYVLSANRITLWLGVFALGLEPPFGTRLWAFDPLGQSSGAGCHDDGLSLLHHRRRASGGVFAPARP